jgi:hypothetical protein
MPRLHSDVATGKSWSLKSRLIGENLMSPIEQKGKKVIQHKGKNKMQHFAERRTNLTFDFSISLFNQVEEEF